MTKINTKQSLTVEIGCMYCDTELGTVVVDIKAGNLAGQRQIQDEFNYVFRQFEDYKCAQCRREIDAYTDKAYDKAKELYPAEDNKYRSEWSEERAAARKVIHERLCNKFKKPHLIEKEV